MFIRTYIHFVDPKTGLKTAIYETSDNSTIHNIFMNMFIHEDLEFFSISLDKYCKEKDIEVCAVKLNITPKQLFILAIYMSHSGNFNIYVKNLDIVLNTWYSNQTEFVICGDININYLENCKKRQQLDALLQTYNLIGTLSFPTCKTNASITAIANIFITMTKNYSIPPISMGF
jgi:hypothetical protein